MPDGPKAATDGLTRRRLIGGATLAGTAAAVGGLTIAGAGPAAAQPTVYTREQWGARKPDRPSVVLRHPPDRIIVHHTASVNTSYHTEEAAFEVSRWIQDLHQLGNGWGDSGQQLTISRGGYVMEGRDRSLEAIANNRLVEGAQLSGHNDHTIGIENEGLFLAERPTDQQFDALVQTCAWLCERHGLDPHQAIAGHKDFDDGTLCPGETLYAMLPTLRDRVADVLG